MVKNRSGRAVAGAHIVLQSPSSGTERDAIAGSLGEFTVKNLAPGLYTLGVNADGYLGFEKQLLLHSGAPAGIHADIEVWEPGALPADHASQTAGRLTVRAANPFSPASGSALRTRAVANTSAAGNATNSPAVFSIYSKVVAPNPIPFGFNNAQGRGNNLADNAILIDGAAAPYDEFLPLQASQDGTDTTLIDVGTAGGTDFYSSVTTGYFVGANARTYRFANNQWSLLRTDTITGYTAVSGSTNPADHTITFATSGPATQAGDVIWLSFDQVPQVSPASNIDSRLGFYCLNWNVGNGRCYAPVPTNTAPYVYDTDVPPSDPGGESIKITDGNTESESFYQFIYLGAAGTTAFLPGHTYRADVWLKESAGTDGTASFSLGDLGVSNTFTGVNATWQHFTYDFPAPASVPAGSPEPIAGLSFNAPGTLWIDNFQIYDTSFSPFSLSPQVLQAWSDFRPSTMRIWSGFGNSGGNYSFWSLDQWLAPGFRGRDNANIGSNYEVSNLVENLPTSLQYARQIGANPWLILNMAYSDADIANLIQYLSAPAGTGYAANRPADHPGPYTSDFGTIYLEVGNEEWGTQETPVNFAYGQWAQFWMNAARSAGWDPHTSNIQFIVNGFTVIPSNTTGVAQQAPDAKWVDYFLYNGGDQSLTGDPYYQSDLLTLPAGLKSTIDNIVAQQQQDAQSGINYGLASYESGPGADTPTHQGDSSLAAGVGALDVELYASLRGFGPMNFFLFSPGGGGPYTSHSTLDQGFLPHPVWEAFQMRNQYCNGPMVLADANQVPTTSDSNQYPLIGVYAFHDTSAGKNDAEVVVISRDLNNTTPVTLNLPFTPQGNGTLYTLTGDPRTNNDAGTLNVPIGSQPLSGITASYTFNVPPGSVYILDIPAGSAWSNLEPIPPAPADLQATAGNARVALRWSAADGADSYNVQRSTASGGPYTSLGSASGTAYTDTSVANGTTYYYVVAAVSTGGSSPNSPEISATPSVEDATLTATAPPIDGSDGGVWANVTAQSLSHHFPGGNDPDKSTNSPDTATFKTLWDNQYLYLLVSVQDATPTQSSSVFSGDSVEVYFSATDSQSSSYGPTDFQYAFPWNGTTVTEAKHNATQGVQFGQQNITGGYQMTIALPWSTLGTTPAAGTQYGFDVMINDAKSNNDEIGKLAWWGTVDQSWQYPYLFGPLVLANGTSGGNIAPIGHRIALYSPFSSHFVTANLNDNGLLDAHWATVANTWEYFDVADAGNGLIALKSEANGFYVSCLLNNGDKLWALSATSIGTTEQFTWEPQANGMVALKSIASGYYATTNSNALSNVLVSDHATTVSSTEQYTWEDLGAH